MIKNLLIIICFFILNNVVFGRDLPDFPRFLQILGQLESNNNDFAVGDNGKSISRYQIQLKCYRDATNYDKSIDFSYKSLTNQVNAARIVKAYISRYCKENDFESWARCWNSGPGWKNKKELTNNYLKKFNKILVNSNFKSKSSRH